MNGRDLPLSEDRTGHSSAFKRTMLAAMTATLLASCSATSDTDMALFGFSPQYGTAGVPADTSAVPAAQVVEMDDPAIEAAASGEDETDAVELATALQPAEAMATETEAPTRKDTAQLAASSEPAQPTDAAGESEAPEASKRGFLSAFFSTQPNIAAPSPIIAAVDAREASESEAVVEAAKPIVDLQSRAAPIVTASVATRPAAADSVPSAYGSLPGVRESSGLFEISRRSGIDDDSDIDLNEDGGIYQVAYAPGLARLAPNGLLKQHDDVDVSCLRPSLVRVLKAVEQRFGQKVIITSGYRDPERNRRARGARNSLHMSCAAADVQVPGVSKTTLAQFLRSMPGRGGVGTYCHTQSVHVDVGPERDWNWRCRRKG